MKHLTEGEMRAYWDQELSPEEREWARTHLESCARCQAGAEDLHSRSQALSAALGALDLPPKHIPLSAQAARLRLEDRIQDGRKENESMFQRMSKRLPRPAWAALALIVLLAVSMAFAPVRAAASNFLSLFRVQQISVIPVDTGAMNSLLASSNQFESMLASDVAFDEGGEAQKAASADEASSLAGFPVRLPEAAGQPDELIVQPGGNASYTIDVGRIRALLQEIGREDIQVPDSANGAKVDVSVSAAVLANYGNCSYGPEQARHDGFDPDQPASWQQRNCTAFVQTFSPEVNAPDDLDLQALGMAFLQLVGMSDEEAATYASNIDWATTLVMPIPSREASATEVQVDGVTGTLVRSEGGEYSLVWIKDGMVYGITGRGSGNAAVDLANSLQYAQ